MIVVVVESPAKAKTINKYLGSGYTVLASYGHIRDLPSKDGSVEPDNDFAMHWEVDAKAAKRIGDIVDAMKGADGVILATDPDREGEAISWHVLEVLQKKKAVKDKTVQRVTFNAITKSSVLEAMAHPRDIDMELVEAYLARRALDYLVGFTLSPVLWRKLPGSRSAGRVQSVCLRLIVDRELEIERFKTQEYWTVEADVSAGAEPFLARLVKHEARSSPSSTWATRPRPWPPRPPCRRPSSRSPPSRRSPASARPPRPSPPRPCSRKPRASWASRPAHHAGRPEAVRRHRHRRRDRRPDHLHADRRRVGRARRHRRGAQRDRQRLRRALRPRDPALLQGQGQERPGGPRSHPPDQPGPQPRLAAPGAGPGPPLRADLEADDRLADGKRPHRAHHGRPGKRRRPDRHARHGQVVLFPGYLAVYEEGRDDEGDEDSARLPIIEEGATAKVLDARADQHFTEPPPRYSEASLVKKMEELGIGRPSTYASVLTVLRDREYVRMDKQRFIPEDKGRLVTAFLEQFFRRYVEYDFTAALEEQLDLVSDGKLDWKQFLRDFWKDFHAAVGEIAELRTTNVLDALNEALGPHIFPDKGDGSDPRLCPTCGTGSCR
jgi:DNA topoisomerase-1